MPWQNDRKRAVQPFRHWRGALRRMQRFHALLFLGLTIAVSGVTGCGGNGGLAPVVDRGAGNEARPDYYRVQRGDTLYGIAWDYGLDHQELAAWNDIESPQSLQVGRRLRLTRPSGAQEPSAASSDAGTTTSQSGESSGQSESGEQAGASPDPDAGDWKWPTDGEVVKAFAGDSDGKQGISIGGERGQAVRAAAEGTVVYSGSGLVGYGNLVILEHPGDFLTAYGYNQRVLVDEGEQVSAGQRIAEMGSAIGEPGIRLHFELRRGGDPVDPTRYMAP